MCHARQLNRQQTQQLVNICRGAAVGSLATRQNIREAHRHLAPLVLWQVGNRNFSKGDIGEAAVDLELHLSSWVSLGRNHLGFKLEVGRTTGRSNATHIDEAEGATCGRINDRDITAARRRNIHHKASVITCDFRKAQCTVVVVYTAG